MTSEEMNTNLESLTLVYALCSQLLRLIREKEKAQRTENQGHLKLLHFKLIPKILMSKECIHFFVPLCIRYNRN
jgi:hypothetical protein